jgi:hypothetical protein
MHEIIDNHRFSSNGIFGLSLPSDREQEKLTSCLTGIYLERIYPYKGAMFSQDGSGKYIKDLPGSFCNNQYSTVRQVSDIPPNTGLLCTSSDKVTISYSLYPAQGNRVYPHN